MYFKIVGRHSNMSHDGDLIRSDLYTTMADKVVLEDVIRMVNRSELSVDETVNRVVEILKVLKYPTTKVECDAVFNISEL